VSPAALDERTEDKILQRLLRERAAKVRALLGLDLTAYLADAPSVADFTLWLEKVDPVVGDASSKRLGNVLRLTDPFRKAVAITRMRSWLREPDPGLGRSPADVLRESADESVIDRLMPSALGYLRAIG
jgi:hypothetical protein